MTTWNEYIIQVKNVEEEMNGIASFPEQKRVRQDAERLKSEDKLLRCTTEDVLYSTVRERGLSMKFVD